MPQTKNLKEHIAEKQQISNYTERSLKNIVGALAADTDTNSGGLPQRPMSKAEIALILKQTQVMVDVFEHDQLLAGQAAMPMDRIENFQADNPRYLWYWFSFALSRVHRLMPMSIGRAKSMFIDAREIAMDALTNHWVHLNWHPYRMRAGQYEYDEMEDAYVKGNHDREAMVMLMVAWLLRRQCRERKVLECFVDELFGEFSMHIFNLKLIDLMLAEGMLTHREAMMKKRETASGGGEGELPQKMPVEQKAEQEVEPAEQEAKPNSRRKGACGRSIEALFMKKDGTKDEALTRRMAQEFVGRVERMGLKEILLDTKKNNWVNKLFAQCYSDWKREAVVAHMPNGNACYRFLAEECNIASKVSRKSYAEFIRKQL